MRRTRIAPNVAAAACAALLLLPAAAAVPAAAATTPRTAAAAPAAAQDRGELVSAKRLYRLATPRKVAAELRSSGFDAGAVRYGVDAYRLEYRTVDPHGRPTTASGLLALPRGREGRLRAVSFAHGTGSHKSDAPSMRGHGFLPSPSLTYASAGFAAVAPDYLGMGTGPGLHPWMDVPSETTASLDMLRAARAVVPLERKVAVTGFSQGASAALGLARSLQAGEDRWFRLGALAPVSGAYDFGGTELKALLGGELEPKSSVVYAAYTLVAFNRLHDMYDRPEQVFRGNARHIEALFDGRHTGRQIMAGTPETVKELLTDEGMRMLEHPTGEFAAALRTASRVCDGWAPRVPTRLYLAGGDQEAAVENTAVCRAELRRRGADVPVVDVGPVDYEDSRHLGSNVAATASIVRWLLSDLP